MPPIKCRLRPFGRILLVTALVSSIVAFAPAAASAEDNDGFPGIGPPPSPFQDSVSASGDLRDVFRLTLAEGQGLSIAIQHSSQARLKVALLGPGSSGPDDTNYLLAYGELESGQQVKHRLTRYESGSGDYYLCLTAMTGTADYSVEWALQTPVFSLAPTSTAVSVVKGGQADDIQVLPDWEQVGWGVSSLKFVAESSQPWLAVTPSSGDAMQDVVQPFVLHLYTPTLAAGSYEATVTVRLQGAEPKTSTVKLQVVDTPTMAISVSASKVKYGTVVTIGGTLKTSTGQLLPGRQAALQSSTNGSSWTTVTAPVSPTGSYSASMRVDRNTYFRWKFAGDVGATPCVSSSKLVLSYAYVTRPSMPSRVRPNRWYLVYGFLKPQHTAGSKAIRVQWQAYYRRHWRSYPSETLAVANYRSYSVYGYHDRYEKGLPKRWRVRVLHSDSSHLPTYSAWEYYKVY